MQSIVLISYDFRAVNSDFAKRLAAHRLTHARCRCGQLLTYTAKHGQIIPVLIPHVTPGIAFDDLEGGIPILHASSLIDIGAGRIKPASSSNWLRHPSH